MTALISNAEIQTIEVLSIIILMVAIMPILVIVMGYKARWPIILHALRKRFFHAFVIEPGNFAKYVLLAKDIHNDKGEIPYVKLGRKHQEGSYFLKDEAFFRHGVDPAIMWKQGNPDPIDISTAADGLQLVSYSSGETRASWNSRTAQELLRTQMNSYEMVILALLMVSVVGIFVAAIYSFEVSQGLATLNHNLCLLVKSTNPTTSCS
jgi:hypothetical protein